MKQHRNQIFIFVFLILTCASCVGKYGNTDPIRIKMFKRAMNNQSTSPNWIILTAIDSQTNKEKEICCETTDLSYALFLDSNDTLKAGQIIESNFKIRFKTRKALKRLGFDEFETEKYEQIKKEIHSALIDSIKVEYKNNERILLDSLIEKYSPYFEKILLENKILLSRDCESGLTTIDKIYE